MMSASMIEPRCLIKAIGANLGFRLVSSRTENGFVGGERLVQPIRDSPDLMHVNELPVARRMIFRRPVERPSGFEDRVRLQFGECRS